MLLSILVSVVISCELRFIFEISEPTLSSEFDFPFCKAMKGFPKFTANAVP